MERNLRVAILDLYEGQPNQGMRCLKDIVEQFARDYQFDLHYETFDVRLKQETPDLSFDVYISSGGPGSPIDSEDTEWEKKYFGWIDQLRHYNERASQKKPVFFICHSFQLACRYWNIAWVTNRKSTAFGVFPIHLEPAGRDEAVFAGLADPFYAVDSRDYQVIQPDQQRLKEIKAVILAIEKERPHVPLERAVMAIRFNEYMIGTQFHPEADPSGMSMYLQREDKKRTVIAEHGEIKWQSMIEQLNDPDKIRSTYAHVLPNFLRIATEHLQTAEA